MNDDLLRNRMLAVASSTDDSDWSEVVSRAARVHAEREERRSWPRRRVLLVVLAGLAVLVVANTAFGLGRRLLDFVEGDPAPQPVKKELARGNEPPTGYTVEGHVLGPPRPPQPPLDLENARLAIARHTSVGPIYLWVAPSAGGGDCRLLQIPALPAGPGGQRPESVDCVGPPTPDRPIEIGTGGINVGGRSLSYACCRVGPDVARLELLLGDGTTMRVAVSKGYFFAELPLGESAANAGDPALAHPIREYRGFDTEDRLVARVPVPKLRPTPQPAEPYRTAITIQLKSGREASIEFARADGGAVCWRQVSPGGISGTCGRVPARALPIGLTGIGGPNVNQLVLLGGPVGSEIARVDLVYDDGSTERLPLRNGFILKQVDEDPRGRWPAKLVGRDETGRVIAEDAVR
jgi:hypothetical protein